MDFHKHQVISRYLVFYVFRKIKTVRKPFSLRTVFYYIIIRLGLLDPNPDLPES